MVYGRPTSLAASLSNLQPMLELDDTCLPPNLVAAMGGRRVTGLTFHGFKPRLYEMIRDALYKFRLPSLQNPIFPSTFTQLVNKVKRILASLQGWHDEFHPIFNRQYWDNIGPLPYVLAERDLPPPERRPRRHLFLRVWTLHLLYESAVIFVNRPLVKYRVASEQEEQEQRARRSEPDPRLVALDSLVKAALRTSTTPVPKFKADFSLSFLSVNFFTAGVILCLVPTLWPLGSIS